MKHTPGPWKWLTSNSFKRLKTENGYTLLYGYMCGDNVVDLEISKPDMALIEAAPDLLSALESALSTAAFEKHPFRPWQNEARAALAKAKGEP